MNILKHEERMNRGASKVIVRPDGGVELNFACDEVRAGFIASLSSRDDSELKKIQRKLKALQTTHK